MDKLKRSAVLRGKLVSILNKECEKSGYVREKVVPAAVFEFLQSNLNARTKMFELLTSFVNQGK
jgi:hypothetical protein